MAFTMQQENQRRLSMLSTPTQDLSTLSSNSTSASTSHKSNFSYSQNAVSIPAAYGYLPQPMWPQEYRPIQGGSRAVPLRMQRGIMNRVESRQIPVPSLQLQPSSDRPYSAPIYLKPHARSGSDGSFTHPPRPATSLNLDSVDKSGPSCLTVFPQHGVAQKPEHDLLALRATTLKELESSRGAFRTIRPVANRGSRRIPQSNTSTVDGNHGELDPGVISSEKPLVRFEEGQKRAASYIDVKPNPPKRIKFNVIQNQSQTATTIRASKQLLMGNTSDVQPTQARKPSSINTAAKEFNNGANMIQGLDTAENIINKADLLGNSRSIRTSGNMQSAPNLQPINISTTVDTLRLSSASPRGLRVENQNLSMFRRQYINNMLPGAVSSEAQVETRAVANNSYSYNLHCETVARSTAREEGEHNSKSLDLQLSRIGDLLRVQDKDGMDTFIKMKFCSKGANILEGLTNELLLGLAVRDVELLESITEQCKSSGS
ncbi:uncharacterized protein F4812DRAFT_5480 [Daldinia caldariorum]|uniref:uncharacterized protein n=1 Tax=Daldinia caldariorum TaxID=326644 RepID=UPI0020085061|nr:uncharacterized protein F4812DRAFT_5480 [Daldinia caldariorum]KAI1472258.1 hypothetical protein F4812DRAFT_5480 [Daldinia caldariorum]